MDGRPNPDALLRQIRRETEAERRSTAGRLKIFFGYAAGVGKTYAMLEAAHAAKKNGTDVVIGYIEPHTRPETMALVDGLEQLPVRAIGHKGVTLRDFDLDAALARAPELILVDELAHTNAEGARHEKRYQDVKELLGNGIDVFTTVNVQHLESLNDLVASITGVTVRERVPDRVFDEAYQVELADIEPEELIVRLQAGKIYRGQQANRALDHFFSVENLTALREIALRRTADRVNRTAQKAAGKAAAPICEHILICLSASPTNPKVIRTAARLRDAFHGKFTALYVAPAEPLSKDSGSALRLRENMRLAERLGANAVTVYGDDVPAQIAEYARVSGITKIVLGRSHTRHSLLKRRRGLVERLSGLVPELDVYIIPDSVKPGRCRPLHKKASQDEPVSLRSGAVALTVFAASAVLSLICARMGFNDASVSTLYVFGVLVTAATTGNRLLGLAMAVASVLTYNFFFTDPRYTLAVYDPGSMLAFALMFLVSIVAGGLSRKIKRQSRQEAMKAYRTEILLQTSRKLQQAENEEALLSQVAAQLVALLGRSVTIYPAHQALGEPLFVPAAGDERGASYYQTADEFAVAAWAFKNRKHAGATTGTLPGARNLYLAARGDSTVYAVVGISMKDAEPLDSFEKNLLLALMDMISLSIGRLRLNQRKNQAEFEARHAQLRANLLRMISHDLRAPLTSISGNAERLLREEENLPAVKRRRLYTDMDEDALWLISLVENLLSITRMDSGEVALKTQPELVADVVDEAAQHMHSRLHGRKLHIQIKDEYLVARMDANLIKQVVSNLLDNAARYTVEGASIELNAFRRGDRAVIEVADDGPGIPDSDKSRLFEMFSTTGNPRGDSRRGIGLGLFLCRTIAEAHGGRISVRDRHPHGSIFSLELRAESAPEGAQESGGGPWQGAALNAAQGVPGHFRTQAGGKAVRIMTGALPEIRSVNAEFMKKNQA